MVIQRTGVASVIATFSPAHAGRTVFLCLAYIFLTIGIRPYNRYMSAALHPLHDGANVNSERIIQSRIAFARFPSLTRVHEPKHDPGRLSEHQGAETYLPMLRGPPKTSEGVLRPGR
jgi:hypothetical protein